MPMRIWGMRFVNHHLGLEWDETDNESTDSNRLIAETLLMLVWVEEATKTQRNLSHVSYSCPMDLWCKILVLDTSDIYFCSWLIRNVVRLRSVHTFRVRWQGVLIYYGGEMNLKSKIANSAWHTLNCDLCSSQIAGGGQKVTHVPASLKTNPAKGRDDTFWATP